MRAALDNNFPGKQFAVGLSVVARDLQGALRTGRIVGQQRSIKKRVAADGKSRIVAGDVEKNIRNRETTG